MYPQNESKKTENPCVRWAKLLLKSKTGTIGFIIVVVVCFIAIFAPYLAPHNPAKPYPEMLLKPPSLNGESPFLLGTDNLGRDILSRIIYGSRISLLVGICSVFVGGAIGVTLGLLSSYYGGIVDSIIMRLGDAFLSIPRILLSMVILVIARPGITTLIFVIGITCWINYARLIRGEVLVIKELEYVKAAKTIGASDRKIIFRHILPNTFSTFIVVSTLTVATNIITESSLSFLGLGIQPPDISWGGMLSDGRNYLASHWWIATFPGLAITITVLGIMFLGDWLRDVLDPRNQGIRK